MGRRPGLASEIRGAVRPGMYTELRVGAADCKTTTLEHIVVRDDGPIFLDVELEPRE